MSRVKYRSADLEAAATGLKGVADTVGAAVEQLRKALELSAGEPPWGYGGAADTFGAAYVETEARALSGLGFCHQLLENTSLALGASARILRVSNDDNVTVLQRVEEYVPAPPEHGPA
jgi:hypothetical protein